MPKGFRYPVVDGKKFCPQCQETKPVNDFYKDSKNQWGVRSPCKECISRNNRLAYTLEGSFGKRRNQITVERRLELKKKYIRKLGGKCGVCGYDKSPFALDFHHTGHKKDSAMSNLLTQAAADRLGALKQFERELKKCVLVCANCHREIHHGLG